MTVISLPKRLSEIGRLGIPPVAGLREKGGFIKVMGKKSTIRTVPLLIIAQLI